MNEHWKPLISIELDIYPLARGFFIIVFNKAGDRKNIWMLVVTTPG